MDEEHDDKGREIWSEYRYPWIQIAASPRSEDPCQSSEVIEQHEN